MIGWGKWMEQTGIEWVKLLKINKCSKKVVKKKSSECNIIMLRLVVKKLGVIGENGAFHLKLKVWFLAHEIRNGERNEVS